MNDAIRRLTGPGIPLVLAAGVLFGCSTAGVKFDTANVPRIAKGTTTKDEVRRFFGSPLRIEAGRAGEVWTYTYVETHTTGAGVLGHISVGVEQSESVVNTLIIEFDGEVVRDYDFSKGSHTDAYLPFK